MRSSRGEAPQAVAVRELHEETGLVIDVQPLRDLRRTCRYVSQPHWRAWFAPAVTGNTEHVFALELLDETALTIHPAGRAEYGRFGFDEAAVKLASWSNCETILELASEQR